MTAYNMPYPGMTNTRESAILSAVAEAVTWKHALEKDGPRRGQRVVVYPKELSQLDQVLNSGDPNVGNEDGHPIAYSAILQMIPSFENPPLFFREDHDRITSDPMLSLEVPKWLNTAARVATGSRRRVLEDGRDVMNSDEEDALRDEHGEELSGVYAPGCASLDQSKMTSEQAAALRAAAASMEPPRSQTPTWNSSDDDDLSQPRHIWSQTKGAYRDNKAWVRRLAASALALPGPDSYSESSLTDDPADNSIISSPVQSERQPTPVGSDNEDQDQYLTEDEKRIRESAKRRAKKGTQPRPEAQASHPMETRKTASGAGSLRGVVCSGQTGYVCGKLSPSSKPGS
jgi:hypothetical protein